jgi:hypothetical protein
MADIDVDCRSSDEGWTCDVTVSDNSRSTHTVKVPETDYESLITSSDVSVESLVEASFEFLLEREPQSAIMGQFDIMTIERYFPEYSETISTRL